MCFLSASSYLQQPSDKYQTAFSIHVPHQSACTALGLWPVCTSTVGGLGGERIQALHKRSIGREQATSLAPPGSRWARGTRRAPRVWVKTGRSSARRYNRLRFGWAGSSASPPRSRGDTPGPGSALSLPEPSHLRERRESSRLQRTSPGTRRAERKKVGFNSPPRPWGRLCKSQWDESSRCWRQPCFYLHDDDEGQLGSQNVPELHGVGVLLHVSGRIAVITIPTRKKKHLK